MQKVITAIIITVIVAGGGAFYGGMKYAAAKTQSSGASANFRNLSPEQRQQRMQQAGTGQGRGGFTNGEIISKDDKSITVKLRDGGSKIIFFSGSSQITKVAAGSTSDLNAGENIMVSGDANQDGSITAKVINLQPTPAKQ